MVLELSRSQASRSRLVRHHLLERAPKARLVDVVSDVCGLQAQVLSSAALALRARVRNLRMADVEDALWHRRLLVKTWSMRGTLHLLASFDVPRHVAAMTWIANTLGRETFARLGLQPHETEATTAAIREALDGQALTREELADAVMRIGSFDAATRKRLRSHWGELLQPAAFAGALCFGPSQGAKVTFVRPDQWLGSWREMPGDGAFATLLRRFVAAYGPVTPHDVGHWWGFLRGRRTEALHVLADELEPVRFEGRPRWILKTEADAFTEEAEKPSVRLLPSWDVYSMFYAPREVFVSGRFRRRVFTPIRGNRPVVLVDGLAAGVWELRRQGDRVGVDVAPFRPLPAEVRRGLEEEADDVGHFLGLRATLHLGSSGLPKEHRARPQT